MADDKKSITYTPVHFYPFPKWTGNRHAVSCKTNDQTYRAVIMLPVPKTAKEKLELYNLSDYDFNCRAVSQIGYGQDGKTGGTKEVLNKAMKDQKCDLKALADKKFLIPATVWFIEKNVTKASKATETSKTQAETGWTHEEMIEYMKKHPKK